MKNNKTVKTIDSKSVRAHEHQETGNFRTQKKTAPGYRIDD